MTFHSDSGAIPDPETIQVGSKIGRFPGPSNNNSRIPETGTGNLETELRVPRIHGTLGTGLQIIPRSLVAPTRGARGFNFLADPPACAQV